ncbi:MAG TPA: DeoR/GlpR transcriptional regulator [Sediminispirochaeta sp.]|nr:DeoR/GlpR transcriptional regulator [Sediminispirochaeta sp.]
MTIRKDLTVLEEMGYLLRTRGGAELAEDKDFLRTLKVRRREHLREKKSIARVAASFVRDDDTIFIDSGSTCTLFAEELREHSLRVVTNSLDVMNILGDTPGITLISLGGNYRKEAGSFIGPMAEENLKNFQLETCFLGTTGVSAEGIFSSQNVIESRLKAQVLGVSRRRVILADSSKCGRTAFSVFARPEDVDVLITDSGFAGTQAFQSMGIEVLTDLPGS